MPITQRRYVNVPEKARELGCEPPRGLAVLPFNFDRAEARTDLLYDMEAASVKALLRGEGLVETPLERAGESFPLVQRNTADWFGPVVFFSAAYLSKNPLAVSVAVNVISNYLSDLFRGATEARSARFHLVEENSDGSGYTCVDYEGSPQGLKDVLDYLKHRHHD